MQKKGCTFLALQQTINNEINDNFIHNKQEQISTPFDRVHVYINGMWVQLSNSYINIGQLMESMMCYHDKPEAYISMKHSCDNKLSVH